MTWREHAECASYEDPEAFFPLTLTERDQLRETVTARTICAMCTVSDQCFTEAVSTGDIYSVAGGTVPAQRKQGKAGKSRHQRTTADEATFLYDGGLTPEHIARAMNIKVASVERSFLRTGKVIPWQRDGMSTMLKGLTA